MQSFFFVALRPSVLETFSNTLLGRFLSVLYQYEIGLTVVKVEVALQAY